MGIFALAGGMGIAIIIMAFIAEYIDSAIGMGYGTALTPILLLLGFEPLQIVPAVLVSEIFTGMLAALFHHLAGNVNLKPKTMKPRVIMPKLRELGIAESFRRGIPLHLKVALLLASCSVVGAMAGVLVAVSLPKFYLKMYIGFLVLMIGFVILLTINNKYGFSWKKITGLGIIAAFNKAISGGGYGPVVTSGQILAGVEDKNAIGITPLAEALTCIVAILIYILYQQKNLDMLILPYLLLGAVVAVPLSAWTLKRLNEKTVRIVIGITTVFLGVFTLLKVLL